MKRFIVVGFKTLNDSGEPVMVRPFMRSDNGVVHYASHYEELQERLEEFGDLSKYEKIVIQEAYENAGEVKEHD
jgi:carbamoylphosphate synthase large subunit